MSAVASSQWNHLNENYVKSVRISLRGSLHGALLKWGFCDLGIFDLDRSHLSRGRTDPLPQPLPSEVRSIICKRWLLRPVLFPSLLCECLCVVVVAAVLFVWFLPPNTFFLVLVFSRYLQERLKQLHEEVNLLKSNIAKYKVAEPWRWHWRFHCTSKCHPISFSCMCQRYCMCQGEAHKSFNQGN